MMLILRPRPEALAMPHITPWLGRGEKKNPPAATHTSEEEGLLKTWIGGPRKNGAGSQETNQLVVAKNNVTIQAERQRTYSEPATKRGATERPWRTRDEKGRGAIGTPPSITYTETLSSQMLPP